MIKGFKFYKGLDNFQLKIMHDDPKKDYFCIYSSFEKMMKQVKFLKEHGKIEITTSKRFHIIGRDKLAMITLPAIITLFATAVLPLSTQSPLANSVKIPTPKIFSKFAKKP